VLLFVFGGAALYDARWLLTAEFRIIRTVPYVPPLLKYCRALDFSIPHNRKVSYRLPVAGSSIIL
jgi:hypothetical protein